MEVLRELWDWEGERMGREWENELQNAGNVKMKMEILRGAWNCVRGCSARRCIDF